MQGWPGMGPAWSGIPAAPHVRVVMCAPLAGGPARRPTPPTDPSARPLRSAPLTQPPARRASTGPPDDAFLLGAGPGPRDARSGPRGTAMHPQCRRGPAYRRACAPGVAGNTACLTQVLWGERRAAGERFTRATYCTRGVTPCTGYDAEGKGQHLRASPDRPVRSDEMFERFTDRARRVVVLAQ